MSVYSRILRSVGTRRWFIVVASRVAPRLDRLVYRVSGRRRLATPPSVTTLFLTTTGRRTGKLRTAAVTYLERGDDFIVVGTNWGKTASPEWALNLAADPRATIEVAGDRTSVEALTIPVEEQEALWDAFAAMWPAFAVYRRRVTDRTIRMFRLRAS